MDWVRLDVDFFRHPRVLGLAAGARLLYLEALCWCGEHETDWIIPRSFTRGRTGPANDLVKAGLWEPLDGGGWKIHDAEEHQASIEYLDHIRQVRSDAAKKRWQKYSKSSANAEQRLSTETETETETTSSSVDVSNDGDRASVEEDALEVLFKRRPPARTNPPAYRVAVMTALRKDHADELNRIDWNQPWTAETLADWLEPTPAGPADAVRRDYDHPPSGDKWEELDDGTVRRRDAV